MTFNLQALAETAPLYPAVPRDYRQGGRPFTVTVAGPGRHEGEKPSVYVIHECSSELAWAKVLAWVLTSEETVDCYVIPEESYQGMPSGRVGIDWSDLRSEYQRQSDLDDLADDAAERLEAYTAAAGEHLDEAGEALPGHHGDVEKITAAYLGDVQQMMRKLSKLTGRD